MKKSFVVVLLLLACVSLARSVQSPGGWVNYTSPEGRYRASLPREPTLTSQESTAGTGEKFQQYLASVAQADGRVFVIGYFDVIEGGTFSAETARDAMVESFAGTLIDETAISLGGLPGRDFKISLKLPGGQSAEGTKPVEVEYVDHARIYEIEKRIYILQTLFPKALDNAASAAQDTKFFDSFQVIKK